MAKMIRSRTFWLWIIFGCFIILGVYITINWTSVGPESTVEIGDVFMCRGPDEDGNPTEAVDKFSRSDWKEIYLCVFVIPNGKASLDAYWIFDQDGRSFSTSQLTQIYESQYLYFSLQDSLKFHITKYYFQDEITNRDFPPGKYTVILRHIRTDVIGISFELTD